MTLLAGRMQEKIRLALLSRLGPDFQPLVFSSDHVSVTRVRGEQRRPGSVGLFL